MFRWWYGTRTARTKAANSLAVLPLPVISACPVMLSSYAGIEQDIDKREAILALVVPVDFSRNLELGRMADVQLIVDGSDANTATIAIGYAQMVSDGYTTSLRIEAAQKRGAKTATIPLEAKPRVWFNQNMQAKNYIMLKENY